MVPNGWSQIQLGSFCDFSQGFQVGVESQSSSQRDGFIRFVRIVDYTKVNEPPRYVEQLENYYTISVNDLVMVRYGEAGLICRGIHGVIANNLFKISPDCNQADKDYLYSWFKFNYRLISSLAASSTMPALKFTDLKPLKVLLPPLLEQRKIAQILSIWDRGIATTEKLIDASKQQKKALMQQLLTGKKRLVDPETGKMFQGEWERHSLSDLVYVDRKSLGKKTPDNFKFKYISLSNVDFGVISKELEVHEFSAAPSRARRVLQDGDILMSTVRPNLKGFAKVTFCYADCIASTGFAVLTPKKKVSGDYIYQYIFSAHVTGQIDSLVVGSNYPAINSSDVSGLKVYCPEFEEQQKIASVLTTADKEIELLEAKLAHLKQEKKALMQQLLTGKCRVKV
ncbi:restriction endonuclease subunit S [Vibrio alginolyticus]